MLHFFRLLGFAINFALTALCLASAFVIVAATPYDHTIQVASLVVAGLTFAYLCLGCLPSRSD